MIFSHSPKRRWVNYANEFCLYRPRCIYFIELIIEIISYRVCILVKMVYLLFMKNKCSTSMSHERIKGLVYTFKYFFYQFYLTFRGQLLKGLIAYPVDKTTITKCILTKCLKILPIFLIYL